MPGPVEKGRRSGADKGRRGRGVGREEDEGVGVGVERDFVVVVVPLRVDTVVLDDLGARIARWDFGTGKRGLFGRLLSSSCSVGPLLMGSKNQKGGEE